MRLLFPKILLKDFKIQLFGIAAQAKGEGKTEDEVEDILEENRRVRQTETEEMANKHLLSSLGKVSQSDAMLARLTRQ